MGRNEGQTPRHHTPERDQPYGTQATRNLNKLIGGRVFVVEKDIDHYGRLVGVIYTPRA